MPERSQVSVRMERAGAQHLKVVWSDGTGSRFPPYRVHRQWIAQKSEAARAALDGLRAAYLNPRSGFDSPLRILANHGAELRRALFQDHVPDDSAAAADPRDWFEELQKSASKIQIMAYADPMLPIPWGLLYENDSGNIDCVDYDAFWALRHDIVALYGGMVPQPFGIARPAENVVLLSGLNQEVFDRTTKHLDHIQRDFVLDYIGRPVGSAFSSNGCKNRFKEVGNKDCVFYFFGHASASELRFADDDILTVSSFQHLFYREDRRQRRQNFGYVLSFLNGCASVTGQDSDSFLVATAYPGFCGFIGAEAIVPDRFALLFGQELLHRILDEGQSVRQAMTGLWRKHKPMGLFYGCYAHPNFAIAPSDSFLPLPAEFESVNHPIPDVPRP